MNDVKVNDGAAVTNDVKRNVNVFTFLVYAIVAVSALMLILWNGQFDRIYFIFLGVFAIVVMAEIWADSSTKPTKAEANFSGSERMLFTEPKTWQKWVFVCWMIAGPLYLFMEWWLVGAPKETDVAKRLAQTQKLASDLWTSCAVIFVVFWGLKK